MGVAASVPNKPAEVCVCVSVCRTTEETVALVWAVEKVGGGKWAEIKKMKYLESDPLERRSAVDLKDKWRNLQVKN